MCTSNHTPHRHSILCILPPHLLEAIAKNGSEEHKEWALRTLATTSRFQGHREVFGGLQNIRPLSLEAAVPTTKEKQITVFNARHSHTLPGAKVRGNNDPASTDVEVNEAFDGADATYQMYFDVFKRHSIDDKGLPINSSVHYGVNYDNAFWDGNQMVYGDGDGHLFNRFTIALDVIGHELTHGVTQYSAGLLYQGQSGALNESMSDVFGSIVKQYRLKQTVAEADWLIGAGLLASRVKGTALRSLKAPGTAYNDPLLGKDLQPAHMKNYISTSGDNGGVHINSGIPNHAFYLAAMALGGHSWEKAGQIWYHTLQQLHPQADFADAAALTRQVADQLYGAAEVKAIVNAWAGVGITV